MAEARAAVVSNAEDDDGAEMAWAQMGRFMGHFCETERLGVQDRRWFALDGADYDDCRELSESTTAENLVPFLDRTLGLSFALLQIPLLPSPTHPAETLASEPPEQRRLGGGSHGRRRLQRNGHGVRPLPPSSPSLVLISSRHAKLSGELLGFGTIGMASANPRLPSNERTSLIVYW